MRGFSGEVIYQHDDETAAALVETMRHLAGKARLCCRLSQLRMNCGEERVGKSPGQECYYSGLNNYPHYVGVPYHNVTPILARILTSQDGFCLMAYEFRDGLKQAFGPTARCRIRVLNRDLE